MSQLLHDLFGVEKPIVAMVHLAALPGRPGHACEAGMGPIVEAVARDVEALQDAGVEGLLFCNEADLPYQLRVGPEAAAATAAVIGQVRSLVRLPFGVDLVWDPVASLAAARATGACFIREVVSGVYESDLGVMRPDLGAIANHRTEIGAGSVAVFGNITPEFASPLGHRSIPQRARSAVYLGVEVLLISGPITGTATDLDQLRAAKAAVPRTPVLANTGVTEETAGAVLAIADGAIVGTHLKRDGITWNPVDRERASRFMEAVGRTREAAGVR
jgi:uncharacterized protein